MTTKTKTDCKTKGLCHYESLTRTKFFHGMLLTDEHLRAEQTYHREALKRLNRHLWGAGIVCGLEVEKTSGLCIRVHPGLALDCEGNVIQVCKCINIDLADVCRKAYPDGCPPERKAGEEPVTITKHLVARYVELPADPQPVLTPDDDCTPANGGTKCEASKYREGFCLEFRDECPDCEPCEEDEKGGAEGLVTRIVRLAGSGADDIVEELRKYRPDCTDSPPCPDCRCGDDGAVGLATLVIDCDANRVEVNCDEGDCRHYVWSPRLLQWLACQLFASVDKLPPQAFGLKQKLPRASALVRNPLQTAWSIGEITLEGRRLERLQQDVQQLADRVAAVEKGKGPKVKPRQDQTKPEQ